MKIDKKKFYNPNMAFSVFVSLLLPLRNRFDKGLIKEIKNKMEA